jgi:hypothetical protein
MNYSILNNIPSGFGPLFHAGFPMQPLLIEKYREKSPELFDGSHLKKLQELFTELEGIDFVEKV